MLSYISRRILLTSSGKQHHRHSCISRTQGHHMDCCDICGDIGVADTLFTCTQCKKNREHMYCMRTILEEPIDDWCCEACESALRPKPLASRPVQHSPSTSILNKSVEVRNGGEQHARKGSVNWEKKVATGKTKYICADEAIMLSSGQKNPFIPSNVTCRSKLPQPKISPRADPLTSKNFTEVQRSESSSRPSQDRTNRHMQKEQPPEAKLPQTKPRSVLKKPSYASLPNASPVAISGSSGATTIEPRTCNAENVSNNLLPDLEKRTCTAALDAFWKGSFNIQDDHRHRELNHQIQAHPPSQVRRKIYEFAKKMPEVLHFQVVPFKKFRNNLFREYSPDARDIGLYFFPGDRERSEDYIFLLEYITAQNLALRTQIADVELLVFTSKVLPVDCQRWKGKYFLWGVLHRLRPDKSPVQPSDASNQVDNSAGIDMDINMIGGVNVGRVDAPVQKKPLIPKRVRFKEDPVIDSASRRDFHHTPTARLRSIKTEPHDIIPPGFDDVCRDRFRNSPRNAGVQDEKGRKTR